MMIQSCSRAEVLEVCRQVSAEYPMIAGGLVDKHLDADDPNWVYAQKALGYLRVLHPNRFDEVLEAFAVTSMDFLRLQARFMRTGRYARQDSSGLVEDLYSDDEKMSGYYLDGLLMTYALWPNHVRMVGFFIDEFLPRLAPNGTLLEVGVGHGLMAALLFERVPGLKYVGVDISASSLRYAASALELLGVDGERARFVEADAIAGDLAALSETDGFDGLVCCEVLEHLDAPDVLLANLRRAVRGEGLGFVSTVANMEADDHVYLFSDVDSIRRTIETGGWRIERDLPNVLPGAEGWNPLPVNYSGMLRPSN